MLPSCMTPDQKAYMETVNNFRADNVDEQTAQFRVCQSCQPVMLGAKHHSHNPGGNP